MNTICLIVLTIADVYCYDDANPIGECAPLLNIIICISEPEEIPLFLSIYDPAICDEYPTNCSDQANAWQSATRMLSPADYGQVAACPPGWLGRFLSIPDISLDVECVDSGGRIHPMFREVWIFGDVPPYLVWQWVIVVDILMPHAEGWPWWSLRAWDQ